MYGKHISKFYHLGHLLCHLLSVMSFVLKSVGDGDRWMVIEEGSSMNL